MPAALARDVRVRPSADEEPAVRQFSRLLIAISFSLLPSLAAATPEPVLLTITAGGPVGGFRWSFLHEATLSCEVIGGVQFCKNGPRDTVSGTLTGTRDGLVLTDIMGTIFVAGGGGDITVTDGTIDFASSAADSFGGELVTSTHGTFSFLDHTFAGPANSFDGATLSLWGNNWNTGNPGVGTAPGDVRWGIDLGIDVSLETIPEPPVAALLGLGLAGLAVMGRRRR